MTDDVEGRRAAGEAMFAEVNGFPAPGPGHPFLEMTVDHVFGEVWTRPGLTRKERRWIAITGVASAGAEMALKIHVTSALQSGDITVEELREAVTHFAVYQGYPRATVFNMAVEEAWARLQQEHSQD
jgi:4-carboxymuconolactone decarboxylase